MGAVSKFEKDRDFNSRRMGSITQGKLGEEQSSQSTELLAAIKSLVDLMGSGVMVK